MKNHLSTLSVLHYVNGGVTCFGGLFMLVLVGLGTFLGSDWLAAQEGEAPPAFLGGLFIVLGWVLFIFIEVMGILNIVSGRLISRQEGRTFSMVVAAFECLHFPIGTALGIYTIVVLNDAEVKVAYESRSRALAG
ncbi:MAG: hypothetical protein IPP33_01750 [Flavobacteriales bacterium]|nr:hypothetical protein [Flavobacteriales bacterium]